MYAHNCVCVFFTHVHLCTCNFSPITLPDCHSELHLLDQSVGKDNTWAEPACSLWGLDVVHPPTLLKFLRVPSSSKRRARSLISTSSDVILYWSLYRSAVQRDNICCHIMYMQSLSCAYILKWNIQQIRFSLTKRQTTFMFLRCVYPKLPSVSVK